MKKKIWIVILIILIISVVIFFTNKDKNIIIDINELSKDIMENVEFTDELNKVDNETTIRLYDINNAVSQIVYMSSGASAEEIAIFEFENKEECKNALEKVNNRIEEQKKNFKDYIPKELKKLENPIIIKKNKYLIVCITDNEDDIEKILKKYIE